MLNIEEFAGGLMKLTMQVNSLLQVPVPHPPPPPPPPLPCFVPLPHWLIMRRASGLCVSGVGKCVCEWVRARPHRYPCMHGGFTGGDPRSETSALAPSPSHQTLLHAKLYLHRAASAL